MNEETKTKCTQAEKIALVFGISGDQGKAVASGLIATGSYLHVYGCTHDVSSENIEAIAKHMSVPVSIDITNASAGSAADHVTIIQVDLNNTASLEQAFERTRATDIFLVTTTDIPPYAVAMGSFHESEEMEYESVCSIYAF